MSLGISLPWPPSVNHYWGSRGNARFIRAEGKKYRTEVFYAIYQSCAGMPKTIRGSCRVTIHAYPPDRRARDLDNILKAPLDALSHAGVFVDDKQVDDLRIIRGEVRPGGELFVVVDSM
jgi:crossover junction endodeoxyribonuclease RusA